MLYFTQGRAVPRPDRLRQRECTGAAPPPQSLYESRPPIVTRSAPDLKAKVENLPADFRLSPKESRLTAYSGFRRAFHHTRLSHLCRLRRCPPSAGGMVHLSTKLHQRAAKDKLVTADSIFRLRLRSLAEASAEPKVLLRKSADFTE